MGTLAKAALARAQNVAFGMVLTVPFPDLLLASKHWLGIKAKIVASRSTPIG